MNLFESILSKAKTNFANPDPTQNLQFKAIQWAANLYTWVAEEAAMGWKRDFERRKEVAKQFLSSKWYAPDVIENTLSQIDYKPNFMGRVREWLGNRMLETARTTETLSNVQNPLQRLGVGTIAYGGDVVATAMEPVTSAVSPFVQAGIEKSGLAPTVQNLGQQFQWFKERNPLTWEAIEWIANLSQLAPVPLVKPAGEMITKGGKAIVRWAEVVAPRVVQGVKTGAEVTGNIVSAPFKSIYNTAKQYVWTPDEIAWIQSAIKPKQKVKNGVVQRSQKQIDNEIQLTNGIIRNKWVKPTDLETYATAQKDILKEIGGEIERLTWQPLDIDVTPSSWKLRMLANSKEVQLLDPSEAQRLLKMADDLDANPRMSLADAEAMNQYINDVLRSTTSTASEAYKRWLQILVQDLRDSLDNAISNIPWEFKDLKRAYGAVRNVYGDTIARQIVFNRQNMGGLIDSFGAIEWFGNIMWWAGKIVTGKVWEWFVDIGKGVTQNAVWRFIKSKNDPNNIIRAIFEKWGKESIIPDIKAKPKAPTPLLPARATPLAIPLGKSQAEIIAESKKGLSPNVKRPDGNNTRNSTNNSPVLDMGTTKGSKQKVINRKAKPSPQVKPVEKTVKPKSLTPKKQSATMGDMETKKLIEEARKYKSAEEFEKALRSPRWIWYWWNMWILWRATSKPYKPDTKTIIEHWITDSWNTKSYAKDILLSNDYWKSEPYIISKDARIASWSEWNDVYKTTKESAFSKKSIEEFKRRWFDWFSRWPDEIVIFNHEKIDPFNIKDFFRNYIK